MKLYVCELYRKTDRKTQDGQEGGYKALQYCSLSCIFKPIMEVNMYVPKFCYIKCFVQKMSKKILPGLPKSKPELLIWRTRICSCDRSSLTGANNGELCRLCGNWVTNTAVTALISPVMIRMSPGIDHTIWFPDAIAGYERC